MDDFRELFDFLYKAFGQIKDFIVSIVLDIIAALILSASVLLIPKLRQRKLKRLFSKEKNTKFDIVCTALEPVETLYYHRSVTGYGELMALANLFKTITYLYGDTDMISLVRLSSSEHYPHYRLKNNIIAIGGATYNSVTRNIKKERRPSQEYNSPWKIWPYDELKDAPDGSYSYFDKTKNKKYQAQKDETGQVYLDYGLITKDKNPMNKNPNSMVIIIDGLHTYGLVSAGELLLPNNLNRFLNTCNQFRDKYFQILIEAKVIGHDVFINDIIYYPLYKSNDK